MFRIFREKLEIKVLALIVGLMLIGAMIIGTTVIMLQRGGLSRTSLRNAATLAQVVSRSLETTMVHGRADITSDMAQRLHAVEGVQAINVYNKDGRAAFVKNAPVTEAETARRLVVEKKPVQIESGDKVVFYNPLPNGPRCTGCHSINDDILGIVKVEIDMSEVYGKFTSYIWFAIFGSFCGISGLSVALLLVLRRVVLKPIKRVVDAAGHLADGDLSFHVDVHSSDEIGRMAEDLRNSIHKVAVIIGRIKDVASRVYKVTDTVKEESRLVLEATVMESGAINNISSSIEESNTAMARIVENVASLSSSAGETAAAAVEMASSTEQVARKTAEVHDAVDSTSASITQMTSAMREVAAAAEELSMSAEETLAAMEQIGASIKEVEGRAKDSARHSTRVADLAQGEGMETIAKTIDGMMLIRESVQSTSDYINQLGSRSEDIGEILTVIDDITDQTTLLALNAAILAAQAGEHGRGFSVVANQIKSLAERTANSTQEISSLIETVQGEVRGAVSHMESAMKRVDDGLKLSSDAKQALERIVDSSGVSAQMAYSIDRATEEQAKGVRVVNTAMDSVRGRIDQIVRATQEQTRGAGLIIDSAEIMRDLTIHVERATAEQSQSSRRISDAVESISERIQQISLAVREQHIGTDQIMKSIEQIKHIPEKSRSLAFSMNKGLRDVMRDNELLETEVARFRTAYSGKDVVYMGVVPLESPAEMYKKFMPFADYLSEKLGKRVELRIPVDFNTAIADIGSGLTQLCFMTPSTYIEAHNRHQVRVLAKALRKGKPYHHTVIIVRADSGINELREIKGRTFAFGDIHSTSSHLVPRAMLKQAGVDLTSLRYYEYLGHHDDVAQAVLKGDFDAGGVMEAVALRYESKGIKLLKYSPEVPEFNMATARDLSADEREALRQAVLRLNAANVQDHRVLASINEDYTGFTDAADADFDPIRQIILDLGA